MLLLSPDPLVYHSDKYIQLMFCEMCFIGYTNAYIAGIKDM